MSTPDRWVHTSYAQRVRFGAGAVDQIADAVKETGGRRVLVVTSERGAASDEGRRLVQRLGRAVVEVFDGAKSHVPSTVLQAALIRARSSGADALVSFGGGSVIDLGKAVVHFTELEQGTPGTSYVDRPAIAHVAVPTTYSGAECTGAFGITDERTRTKGGGGSPTCIPLGIVYDPLLTLDLSPRSSAASGLNALAHAVEVAYARDRTPIGSALALDAVRRIVRELPVVVDEPGEPGPRAALLEAAHLAGACLREGSVGVHHGVAQLLGGRTGISHGLANAVVLPHALRFNADALGEAELSLIGDALGDRDDPAGAVERLLDRVGLPRRLRDCGVDEEDLDAVARMSGRSPAILRNLRPAGESDVRAILQGAW